MSDELIARVTGVIAKTQKIPPETVTIDKSFEELKIDSLDGINILFALEGEFDIDIPDDAARGIPHSCDGRGAKQSKPGRKIPSR